MKKFASLLLSGALTVGLLARRHHRHSHPHLHRCRELYRAHRERDPH